MSIKKGNKMSNINRKPGKYNFEMNDIDDSKIN